MDDLKILKQEELEAINVLKKGKKGKYLSNKELREELTKSNELGRATKKLHSLFFLMAIKISNRRNFYSYKFKYGMIKDAYMHCINKYHMFDLTKTSADGTLKSPFSYYTSAIINKFIEIIKIRKEEAILRYRLRRDDTGVYYRINDLDLRMEQKNKENNALKKFNSDNKSVSISYMID